MRLTDEVERALEDLRAAERPVPTRTDVVARLILREHEALRRKQEKQR